jgi:RHS repeat-associated protein
MAMSVTYTTIDGEIVYENRGGVQSFYVPDTLGSTVALTSPTGTVTDTYSYWPFGEIRNHVGTSQTPFTYIGTLGYYLDLLNNFIYIRARYLRQALARWQTVDPLWPQQRAYSYCRNLPSVIADPFGLKGLPRWPWDPAPAPPGGSLACNSAWNRYIWSYCNSCYYGVHSIGCEDTCDAMARQYYSACGKGDWPHIPTPFPFQPRTPGGDIVPTPIPGTGGGRGCPSSDGCFGTCHETFLDDLEACGVKWGSSGGGGSGLPNPPGIGTAWCVGLAIGSFIRCVASCAQGGPPTRPVFEPPEGVN